MKFLSNIEQGARLKKRREELGYTQEEVGEKLGVNRQAIYKIEKGFTANLKRNSIEILSKLFLKSPTWIMGGIEETEKINTPDISMLSQEQKQKLDMILASNMAMFFNGSKDIDEEEEELIKNSIIEVYIYHLKETGQL